jgi:excisionase family DNA binding protein
MPNALETDRAGRDLGRPLDRPNEMSPGARAPLPPLEVEGPPLAPATWPAGQVAFTVKQVAEILGMTEKAIYHRAARGQIPGKFYVGKSLRFRRADLLRSISEGRGLAPTRSR